MGKRFKVGDKVRFGRIHGIYRGVYHDDVAMVVSDDHTLLYYIKECELDRDDDKIQIRPIS